MVQTGGMSARRNAIVALSCGILVLTRNAELLLCHATGTSRWDIPKGGGEPGEADVQVAIRETAEECGLRFAADELLDLGRHPYRRDKDLHLYAALSEAIDPRTCVCSSSFRDRYGRLVPEMDRFEWLPFERVVERCGKSMAALLRERISLPEVLDRLLHGFSDGAAAAAPARATAARSGRRTAARD